MGEPCEGQGQTRMSRFPRLARLRASCAAQLWHFSAPTYTYHSSHSTSAVYEATSPTLLDR